MLLQKGPKSEKSSRQQHPMSIFRRITPPILLLLISEVLLILLFPGSSIIESTITAGGDTPSHFISAIAMSRGLLSLFSPVTWIHGAYAGFPLFLHYFPLPFALMALISKAVSLQVAFKLVTLLAIIPLPAAVYLCLRRLGYRQNTPAIGAVLSLPFLLMTENSMWGGNIYSTLSGEFAFGISFILYIIFTGKLYADISARKSPLGNSALEAFIAMSNGYPLLQSANGDILFHSAGREPAIHTPAPCSGGRTRRILAAPGSCGASPGIRHLRIPGISKDGPK